MASLARQYGRPRCPGRESGLQPASPPALADAVRAFRDALGTEHSSYGVAYFPYLAASIVRPDDLDDTIVAPDELAAYLVAEERNGNPSARARLYEGAARQMNLLPASVAMAGVITACDNNRGVWNAPANIAINAVYGPALRVDDETQADFNNPLDGKAINVIREFAGRGTVVWGARTLDGNSDEYRYVQVRRTVIYLEQSIKAALKSFVFEPNDDRTWAAVAGMVSQFLQNLWAMGGLLGATAREAFVVRCGLGSTMSAQDMREGYMVVVVLVAITRPDEFIELTFKQKMEQTG